MTFRKILTVSTALVAAGLVTAPILAAGPGGCGGAGYGAAQRNPDNARAEMMAERMANRLGLTEEQQSAVETIIQDHRTKRQAMREQMRGEMREQLGTVLTDEQVAEWDRLKGERFGQQDRGRGPGHGRGYGGHHRHGWQS